MEEAPFRSAATTHTFVGDGNTVASAVSQAATEIAVNVEAQTIVAFTESGNTARLISKYRPEARIVAFTPNEATLRQMAPYQRHPPPLRAPHLYRRRKLASAADDPEREGVVGKGDRMVMVAGVPPNVQASTNLVKVHVIGGGSGGLGS